ncbi:MAG: elongation factor Ts [Bacteroidetes bacterium]|nr:elongation factor Ts [Bacteroidota bacterium]HET6243748.1 translation elongation factor Ts [Bacteroidia bacterium]
MTTTITAADVNKLRTMTGAGMMDCKKALVEANGDFEAAIDNLRKKGQKVAANRSERDATEGVVVAKTAQGNKKGVLLVVNCETDFVAKNQEFSDFVYKLADIAIERKPINIEEFKNLQYDDKLSVNDKLIELMGKIGEKIDLSAYEIIEAEKVVAYNHPGNKLATIVGFSKSGESIEQVAKQVAMQVAAMAPVALDKDAVDAKTIEREIEIAKELARQEGKPEDMLEKIAVGRLNKFFKESTLLNQESIIDNKKTVSQYLKDIDKDLTVTGFKRISLG